MSALQNLINLLIKIMERLSMKKIIIVFIGLCLVLFSRFGISSNFTILGAGATFPYPLYDKWFHVYENITGIKVNYQAIGSGGGIRQLINRIVDFGATDAFMSNDELHVAPAEILHFPTCIGAVVITYNLPRIPTLRFTPDILADIFLGKITKWNDKRIVEVNPNIKLPNMSIVVVHRADGSGTTFIFSDYLSKISEEWKKEVGVGKTLNWPVGLGGKGNPGVSGLVRQIPGSIGYVELIYAKQNKMPVGLIENKAGHFIKPTLKSISLAANIRLPDDTRMSITDTNAPYGYPICSFSWIIFYKEQFYGGRSLKKAKALAKLFWWMIHEGQKYNERLLYARLPHTVIKKAELIIKNMTYKGKPIIK